MSTSTLPELPSEPEQPKSLFERAGAALPIALTAIATAFAGMSTSELSYAMYWRSSAAQDQSKANDQWTLAGFKRDRSLIVQSTAELLRAMTANGVAPKLSEAETAWLAKAERWRIGDGLPIWQLPPVQDPAIQAILAAVRDRKPEDEVLRLARPVNRAKLDEAITAANGTVADYEKEWEPILRDADEITESAGRTEPERQPLYRSVRAGRYDLDSRRYRAEATLNQQLGYLYEVRVKTSTAESDRHLVRSKFFFYAMLAGQVGATLASFNLARKMRSSLWALAGITGLIAVAFGTYVYLGM